MPLQRPAVMSSRFTQISFGKRKSWITFGKPSIQRSWNDEIVFRRYIWYLIVKNNILYIRVFPPFSPLCPSAEINYDVNWQNCIYLNQWCSLMLITKFKLMMLSFKSTLYVVEEIVLNLLVIPPVLLTIKESKNIL